MFPRISWLFGPKYTFFYTAKIMLGIYTNLRYAIRQYHNEDSIVFVVAKSAAGLSIRAWRVKFQKITAQKIQVHLGLG
jgi:hypothetical protein